MKNNINRLYNNIERLTSEGRLKEVSTDISKEIGYMDEIGMTVSVGYLNDMIEEDYYENND